ncbi:type IV pilus secretin PilQ [Legionella geestiana]|uniref:type IV pilus secretin PilQ n=1 Tax=Legionella geestiana TaxID=45065 RepID=UPI001091C53D|nr:type IV pilus secretin PilQ [Legionella geestiana]QDQ39124.1 type IV pilus secretin PilQ [Legionella geestiana]
MHRLKREALAEWFNRFLLWRVVWQQVLLCGVGVVIWSILHLLLVVPVERDSARLLSEVQSLNEKALKKHFEGLEKGREQALCQRMEEHTDALTSHFGLDGRREHDFQALAALSRRCGLDFTVFRPLKARPHGSWMLLPMDVEMAGNFSGMACLSVRLSALSRLLLPLDFTLEERASQSAIMPSAQWLQLRLKLVAFRARSRPPPAKALPTQGEQAFWWPGAVALALSKSSARNPFMGHSNALTHHYLSQGLDSQERGNVVFDASKAPENAHQPLGNAALQTGFVEVRFAKAADIAGLIDGKGTLLSPQGRCGADPRTNIFWVQDDSAHVEVVQNMVKRLDVPVRQVLIEARIVNVNRDYAEDIGVRLGMGEVVEAGNIPEPLPPGGHVKPFPGHLNVDLLALSGSLHPASMGLAMAKLGTGVLLDMELSALESEGRGHVVASPRLVTANLEPAVIESGEEIPYQEATVAGATAVTFKKAVLSLRVTPRIAPDNTIYMVLQINQDTPSRREVQNVPAVLTREIRTSVRVDNGQTVVLGGIHQQGQVRDLQQVPFLGGLPVVGALFRKTATKIRNEELLIFITPRIIPGESPGYMGVQGDGATPPERPATRAGLPAAAAFAVSMRDSDSCKQDEVCNQR